MGEYDLWAAFFAGNEGNEIEISFTEFAEALPRRLPLSAYRYTSFWQAQRRAVWRDYGWIAAPDLKKRVVRFTRVESPLDDNPRGDDSTTSEVPTGEIRLVLIGGVAGKREEPRPARDLYTSTLWSKRRSYAEATGSPWRIVSAEYGLVDADLVLEPYDVTLKHESVAFRRRWSERVASDVILEARRLGLEIVEVHAGADQLRHGVISHLNAAGLSVSWPLRGRRIGEQLLWYSFAIGAMESLSQVDRASDTSSEVDRPDSLEHDEMPQPPVETESRPGLGDRAGVGTDVGDATSGSESSSEQAPSSIEVVRRDSPEATGAPTITDHATRGEEGHTGDSAFRRTLLSIRRVAERFIPSRASRAIEGDGVVEDILRFKRDIAAELEGSTVPSSAGFPRIYEEKPFSLLVTCIIDREAPNSGESSVSSDLLTRLGYMDPESMVDQPQRLVKALSTYPPMVKSPERTASSILAAAKETMSKYEGDAAQIWETAGDEFELRDRLRSLIGPREDQIDKLVAFIREDLGLWLPDVPRDMLEINESQRRVFLRTGLMSFDELTGVILPAIHPPDDAGFWDVVDLIGSEWCHESGPDCEHCALVGSCPRLLESGRVDPGA